MKSTLSRYLKQIYNECITPTMIHGYKTRKLTRSLEKKFRNTQRSNERTMLGLNSKRQKGVTINQRINQGKRYIRKVIK